MIRFAQFGAGFIGKIHGANIARHPKSELAYIYDVNTAAAEDLAARALEHATFFPKITVCQMTQQNR